jgi:Holliday junction resolvase RusA-like endonuclease
MILRVVVPTAPPSGQHRSIRSRHKGKKDVKTARTLDYERDAGIAMVLARNAAKWQQVKWCRVDYELWNIESDWDNALKVIQDCMKRASLIVDDKYIIEGGFRKDWDDDGPRIVVEVEAIEAIETRIPAKIIHGGRATRKRSAADVLARAQAPRKTFRAGVPSSTKSVPGLLPPAVPRRKP